MESQVNKRVIKINNTGIFSDIIPGQIIDTSEGVKVLEVPDPDRLSEIEIQDINESLKEIESGRSKRYRNVNDCLKWLKE